MTHLTGYEAKVREDARETERRRFYSTRPVQWMRDYLGVHPDSLWWSDAVKGVERSDRQAGDYDPLARAAENLVDGPPVVHLIGDSGVGKTYLGASLGLWFLDVFPGALVPVLDVRLGDLRAHGVLREAYRLATEEGGIHGSFRDLYPNLEVRGSDLLLNPNDPLAGRMAGSGWARSEPATLGGMAAKDLLVIVDNAQEAPPPVLTAIYKTITGENNRALLLETRVPRPGVVQIDARAEDHPNVVTGQAVVPGAVTRESLARLR